MASAALGSNRPDHFRTLLLLTALYLAGILSANAMAAKLLVVFGVHVTTGALAIPLVYLTTDLINELYGAAETRRVVWLGLLANCILVAMTQIGLLMPVSPFGATQQAAEAMFSVTPRIVVASMVAYLVSSMVDVQVFVRLRELTKERHFWLRKNGSTVVSQFLDSGLFVAIAFGGSMPVGVLASMVVGQYLVKIAAAPLGTPLSYAVLRYARRQ